jgi:AraC-like DNA-binding protein
MSPVLKSLLQNTQPLFFEQIIIPSLQKIVDEILNEPVNKSFELFFLRIKTEELICRLLIELEKRDEQNLSALNSVDIQAAYKIKERMLAQLNIPPDIKELAISSNMSPSKLKRLFKQIFGNSIFRYYQEFRMKEAARLLKEEKLSVSEVGYRLGFTNLSHFSRVFQDHTGMKPKQYSRS